jgi:hypothetical protein
MADYVTAFVEYGDATLKWYWQYKGYATPITTRVSEKAKI